MMKNYVTIIGRAITGSRHVLPEEGEIFFIPSYGLLINGRTLNHHGFSIEIDDLEGFFVLTAKNIEEKHFNEFMADRTPDDVLDGTGVPTYTKERTGSFEELEDEPPDELGWTYGANIVLAIHGLAMMAEEPTHHDD